MKEQIENWSASIVVPLKRQVDDWLERCVLSAVDQTARCQVIVVTHPQTPVSNLRVLADIKSSYSNLFTHTRPPDKIGFAGAINTGIALADAGRVALLLSDDWLAESAVQRCLELEEDIISTGNIQYDSHSEVFHTGQRSLSAFDSLDTTEARACYLGHFLVFNKSSLLEVGGVDEAIGLTGADDYDLIWTLLENGATVNIVEDCLYHYRDHHGERLTLRDRDQQIQDLCKILDKHGVVGSEKERLVDFHSRWYGRPHHVVMQEA